MAYLIPELFPFELSKWQQKAVIAIENGDNCLVTAPTGSGKTVPAEFAIAYFNQLEHPKKVIYTSPIKALSNQKYYEFQKKFPHISFGILTGDIKDNPDADVLIMTTEILRNNLHNLETSDSSSSMQLDFNIDIQNELGCVIFDEVHYINDLDRGTVWEESFMLLPSHIQLTMLSATIARPKCFAKWIESIHKKKVVLCDSNLRNVPLKHYLWFCCSTQMVHKKINDPTMLDKINATTNQLVPIYTDHFHDDSYHKLNKVRRFLDMNKLYVKRTHILNSTITMLKKQNMLPAICFIYSRKNVEKFATEIESHLIDGKLAANVQKECRHILCKFDNYKEYIHLPEYEFIVGLLEKGIAIHHSGLLPVFREMIELLFSKGYVKLLFATETFAVGLNMPTKTVLFTDLQKFDGHGKRFLESHEYTQQAGRAGRRGFDTVGHVIHLNNLFDLPAIEDYRIVLNNKPQTLISKFKISYDLILHLINSEKANDEFVKQSIINSDLDSEINQLNLKLREKEKYLESAEKNFNECQTSIPVDEFKKYLENKNTMHMFKNKTRKVKEKEIADFQLNHPDFETNTQLYECVEKLKQEQKDIAAQIDQTQNFISHQIYAIKSILLKSYYLDTIDPDTISIYGQMALNINEVHCLAMTDALVEFNYFKEYSIQQIIAVFSCFTNIRVSDEIKLPTPKYCDYPTQQLINYLQSRMDYFYQEEVNHNIYSGANYDMHFDMVEAALKWCDCDTEPKCIQFLTNLKNEKNIFIGEFTKAILKINNIAKELSKICEKMGQIDLLSKLTAISPMTLKYICTTQSLYI